jgi:hypothetical protein
MIVAISLAVIGIWAFVDQRSAEGQNLGTLIEQLSETRPVAQVEVVAKEVRQGAVATRLHWSVPGRGGPTSPEQSFSIVGERLRLESGTVRVKASVFGEELSPPVYYFRWLSGGSDDRFDIYQPETVPDTHRLRGELDGRMEKMQQRFWTEALGGKDDPRLDLHREAGERLELDLAIGDRIEFRIDDRGTLSHHRVYSEIGRLSGFQQDRQVFSAKGIGLRLKESQRLVEHAGLIRPRFDNCLLTVEVTNDTDSEQELSLDDFLLEDSRARQLPSRSPATLKVPPHSSLVGKLRFLVPMEADGLKLVLPNQLDEMGKPLQLYLAPSESGLGDVVFAGDFAFVATHLDRKVNDGVFSADVGLVVLNHSDKERRLDHDQFGIQRASQRREEYTAESISVDSFLPHEPTEVIVTVPLGESLVREDLKLHIVDARKRVEQQHAHIVLVPALGGEAQVHRGVEYLNQVAATAHYERWLDLSEGRNLRKLFGGKKTSLAEATRHLNRAKELFPDSETIAGAGL